MSIEFSFFLEFYFFEGFKPENLILEKNIPRIVTARMRPPLADKAKAEP